MIVIVNGHWKIDKSLDKDVDYDQVCCLPECGVVFYWLIFQNDSFNELSKLMKELTQPLRDRIKLSYYHTYCEKYRKFCLFVSVS